MKLKLLLSLSLICSLNSFSQSTNRVHKLFPEGTELIGNIPYNDDTLKKHLLDIYLPDNVEGKLPLIVFIHGGGWLVNDKYADIGYMGNTVSAIINEGYALASIDYRFASQATFPALIQDCNKALSFLCDKADTFHLDPNKIAIMGFSAGGHLASLLGLANNNEVSEFFMDKKAQKFSIKGVLDYYGPSELASMPSSEDPKAPEAILLGATPIERPDLSAKASPITYVDENDPPFLIFHGEKDDMVPNRQSKLLHGWLNANGVQNELTIVPDAPHYGKMFDTAAYKDKVIDFLREVFK